MKVKGLIASLKKIDPNLNVYVIDNADGNEFRVGNVSFYEPDDYQGCVFINFE